jgi:hypothetical protein
MLLLFHDHAREMPSTPTPHTTRGNWSAPRCHHHTTKPVVAPMLSTRRARNTCAPLDCVLKPMNRDATSKLSHAVDALNHDLWPVCLVLSRFRTLL